jgi:DNA-binding NtrC family response regulator
LEPSSPDKDSASLGGLSILYADDEPQLLDLFGSRLRDAGAIVHACRDLEQAKAVLSKDSKIDIVLTDYRLGLSGTGLDVVQAARSSSRTKGDSQLPVVILTGDTAVKDFVEIRRLSACALLHKPVDFEDLSTVLLALHRQHTSSAA